jgi:polyisoprenoid-binding protein YceI
MRQTTNLLGAAAILALAAHTAQAERYAIDPVHSRVLIRVSHAGFAQAMATLSAPRGFIDYDADAPEAARVEVELPLDRLDFGDADWNRRMARRDYFDSERHPTARFVSTSVQAGADGELRVEGRLELRGERVPVTLAARINRIGRDLPYVPRHSLGASATATLDRRDFGMDRHAGAVGNAVEVWIEVEARRQRRGERDGNSGTSSTGARSPSEHRNPNDAETATPEDSTPADSTPADPPPPDTNETRDHATAQH